MAVRRRLLLRSKKHAVSAASLIVCPLTQTQAHQSAGQTLPIRENVPMRKLSRACRSPFFVQMGRYSHCSLPFHSCHAMPSVSVEDGFSCANNTTNAGHSHKLGTHANQ